MPRKKAALAGVNDEALADLADGYQELNDELFGEVKALLTTEVGRLGIAIDRIELADIELGEAGNPNYFDFARPNFLDLTIDGLPFVRVVVEVGEEGFINVIKWVTQLDGTRSPAMDFTSFDRLVWHALKRPHVRQ